MSSNILTLGAIGNALRRGPEPVYAYDDDDRQLDARYEVERDGDGLALILASASGKHGNRPATNTQYKDALLVLLQRLKELKAVLDGALVDSSTTRRRNVPEDERRIIDPPVELSVVADIAELGRQLQYRQSRVARTPDAKREDSNATRRIRLRLTVPGFGSEDAKRLADVLAQRFHQPLVLGQGMMEELPVGPLPPSMLQFPQNAEERSARAAFDAQGVGDAPISDEDARKHVLRGIFARQGQSAFRDKLICAYRGRCAVTGCTVIPVLEAAHLRPYRGLHTNRVTNGLLLRADIHTLLDYKYLAADPETRAIVISKRLVGTQYNELSGRTIAEPISPAQRPTGSVLERVWQEFRQAEAER